MTRVDEDEIRELVERWAHAVRAKDLAGAIAHHADDIVMFDAPMPLQLSGLDAYRDSWVPFFAQSPGGPGAFDLTELQVTAGESVAYCHAIVNIRDSQVRLTVGLRKEDGDWVVAHEHHSYPIALDQD